MFWNPSHNKSSLSEHQRLESCQNLSKFICYKFSGHSNKFSSFSTCLSLKQRNQNNALLPNAKTQIEISLSAWSQGGAKPVSNSGAVSSACVLADLMTFFCQQELKCERRSEKPSIRAMISSCRHVWPVFCTGGSPVYQITLWLNLKTAPELNMNISLNMMMTTFKKGANLKRWPSLRDLLYSNNSPALVAISVTWKHFPFFFFFLFYPRQLLYERVPRMSS